MNEQNTQQNIQQFFERFKQMPEYYEFKKVHQLVNSPNAMAMHRVIFKQKPFKFLIMTTLSALILSALLFWAAPFEKQSRTEQDISGKKEIISTKSVDEKTVPKIEKSGNNKEVVINFENEISKQSEEKTISEKTVLPVSQNTPSPSLPLWPEDTVIDGNRFIVTLTDEEMEKLGFLVDETGIYYKNEWEGNKTCFHSRYIKGQGGEITVLNPDVNRHNKKENYSSNSFYPVILTNYPIFPNTVNPDNFILQNDTLLPVRVSEDQLKYRGTGDKILWFIANKELFQALPIRYKHLEEKIVQIKQQKKVSPQKNFIDYIERTKLTDNIKMIDLTFEELKKLGFTMNKESIRFKTDLFEPDSVSVFFELNNRGNGIVFDYDIKMKPNNIRLIYLTNEYGEHSMKWAKADSMQIKYDREYILKKIQCLIPVILKKDSYPDLLYEDKVFWFEPTEALFDSLPQEIGNQLRMEYNYITAETTEERKNLTTTCTFFEACRSSLDLPDLKIYPNPTKDYFNIEFSLEEPLDGDISLLSISGIKMKTLVSSTLFATGNNTYNVDISGISPGIYLIMITTNQGFKTQRLVISE